MIFNEMPDNLEANIRLPDYPLNLDITTIRAEPRRWEHQDGTPVLWPSCFDGECMKCNERRRLRYMSYNDISGMEDWMSLARQDEAGYV